MNDCCYAPIEFKISLLTFQSLLCNVRLVDVALGEQNQQLFKYTPPILFKSGEKAAKTIVDAA
ncbi:hypothetical protein T12_9199 [Trichinella patagoniensis]|uniref:Uncharacterized protein n=1 Tax=Trichinella patagoniensis TaxID=990121 RepID=A0A0V0ZBC7_9BILA|nr:hypothetical protein T12_9199 [Trichinella patagoniensis]